MKLLIDAGNTRIKWAVADGQDWLHSGVLPVEQAGELQYRFAGLEGIRQVWVSNVAGVAIAQHIRNACTPSQSLRFIETREAQCGVRNSYSIPSQLGSDRWAALIAAWHRVRGACLVVNSGTATTVDALSHTGEFVGGLILPGVELMQHSLRNTAVQLQTVQVKPEQGQYAPFPLNTADALYSGALQACCGAIERQYALLCSACQSFDLAQGRLVGAAPEQNRRGSVPLVLSGGAAAVLRNHLSMPLRMVDNLVLQGVWLISQDMR